MRFFWPWRKSAFREQIRVLALLGYRYNSFHRTEITVDGYCDRKKHPVTVVNQFIAADKRHAHSKLEIACWKLQTCTLRRRIPHLLYANFFGVHPGTETRFYFPLALTAEYPDLVSGLGAPDGIYPGILTPSGRSIWVPDGPEGPFCLKIDTMQLSERRFFSERALFEKGIIHSAALSAMLKKESNIFDEDSGASFNFSHKDPDGNRKNYNYLIRKLDIDKTGLRRGDHLLPIVALLSTKFWENRTLLESFRLPSNPATFLIGDLARGMAGIIRNSLDNTFLHFEIHQQNLTLQVRDGRGIKLLYHDLQDTVLDPVSYFLHHILAEGSEAMEKTYLDLYEAQKSVSLNSHGHLRVNTLTQENFSVVSLYRRYLRNFGHYTQTYNFFARADYIAGRDFEQAVLKYLNFTDEELEINPGRDAVDPFLRTDLFWNIDRYHIQKQKRALKTVYLTFLKNGLLQEEITAADLLNIIQQELTICSHGFPVYLRDLDITQLQNIRTMYHRRIFFAEYRGQTVMLLFFQYI